MKHWKTIDQMNVTVEGQKKRLISSIYSELLEWMVSEV